MQKHSASDRRHDIIAAVHDDTGYSLKPACIEQKLTVSAKKAAVDEIMTFNSCERDRIRIGAEASGQV